MIWLSVKRDVFIANLLRLDYEKILLMNTALFRGDYQVFLLTGISSLAASMHLE